VIVNPVNGTEVPTGVVTETVRVVKSAVEPIAMVAGTLVKVPTVPIVAVT
jgi:hypothetical protein